MQIEVSKKQLKRAGISSPTFDEVFRFDGDDYTKRFELAPFKEEQLEKLLGVLREDEKTLKEGKVDDYRRREAQKDAGNSCKAIRNELKIRRNTTNILCNDLKSLVDIIKTYVRNGSKRRWLYCQTADEQHVPFFLAEVKYEPGQRNSPAYTYLKLCAMERGLEADKTIHFYKGDLVKRTLGMAADSGQSFSDVYDELDDEEFEIGSEHEEEEEEGKKKKSKPRIPRYMVEELLLTKHLILETEELTEDYIKEVSKYRSIEAKLGRQFIASGSALDMKNDYWTRNIYAMTREGRPSKVVMDNTWKEEKKDDYYSRSDDGKRKTPLIGCQLWTPKEVTVCVPTHPYCQVFDLLEHRFVKVHVNNLEEYKFDKKLIEKLVLNEDSKGLVEMLVESSNEMMEDIIAGKTGGVIVIATGPPGIGKTLTAEVYSEVLEKPLYNVQCSQLGTNEETLEKRLKRVLALASRWGALLLVDEADVYVRTRGDDIQQNAIVGVFLRLLEYYRGVLFMTSNRDVLIDDAVLSRATCWIKYEMPTNQELHDIWLVLAKQFGIELSEKLVAELVEAFPQGTISGRNVKNLLKLGKMRADRKHLKLTVDLFKWVARFQDINSLTTL